MRRVAVSLSPTAVDLVDLRFSERITPKRERSQGDVKTSIGAGYLLPRHRVRLPAAAQARLRSGVGRSVSAPSRRCSGLRSRRTALQLAVRARGRRGRARHRGGNPPPRRTGGREGLDSIAPGTSAVLIDLWKTSFMDSSGLRLMLAATRDPHGRALSHAIRVAASVGCSTRHLKRRGCSRVAAKRSPRSRARSAPARAAGPVVGVPPKAGSSSAASRYLWGML